MREVVHNDDIKIARLVLGTWSTNMYIVQCQATKETLLVDAPDDADAIIKALDGTKPKYLMITHSHVDHIGATDALRARLRIPVAVHPLDAKALSAPPTIDLSDEQIYSVGRLQFRVLHTPGHTPGSVSFLVGKYLFSGDALFPGGPGKTWTPDQFKQITHSITTKIFPLPDDTEVYPGHGLSTILSKEKGEYAIFVGRAHAADLCGDVSWLTS
jgi:hydroxyacylglutathione hydrolase